jgi:hypothetical protein
MNYAAMDIIISRDLNDTTRRQARFPRSKSRRIRKKWAKRPENFVVERKPVAFKIGGRIVCNDLFYNDLYAALR